MIKRSVQDGVVLVFNENDQLVAVVVKNGHPQWFKVEEMSYGDMCELLEINSKVQE